MSTHSHAFEPRYTRLLAWRAGQLPRDPRVLDAWTRQRRAELNGAPIQSRGVLAFAALLERDPILRMYTAQMIEEVPPEHRAVDNTAQLLEALDRITRTAPAYNLDPTKRNAFPMSALFAYMMMTPAGAAAFRDRAFNHALKGILSDWCAYLDSPASTTVLNEGDDGWLCPYAWQDMKLWEFQVDLRLPHGGFRSYNAFFHRHLRPSARPLAAPDDPKVIVSPNDGNLVTIARGVKAQDKFWLKGEPFSLMDMLAHSPFVERFVGGSVFQSFLSGANYHRWHAPISGIVREARVVDGLMFSEAESAGFDPNAGVLSEGYDATVNTRGLVFIESPDPKIGMVCMIPVGITEISSITLGVKVGDSVKKGEEIGYFSYGGSSMAIAFQRSAIDHFTTPTPPSLPVVDPSSGPPVLVNAQIAVAR